MDKEFFCFLSHRCLNTNYGFELGDISTKFGVLQPAVWLSRGKLIKSLVMKSLDNRRCYLAKVFVKTRNNEIDMKMYDLLREQWEISKKEYGIAHYIDIINYIDAIIMIRPYIKHNLGHLIARGLGKVLKEWIIHQILVIMEGLHRKDIIHGDLKIENVLLDERYKVFISDLSFKFKPGVIRNIPFDVWFYFQQESRNSLYLSPERIVFDEKEHYEHIDSKKADIFSLGCIIYEISVSTKGNTSYYAHNTEWLRNVSCLFNLRRLCLYKSGRFTLHDKLCLVSDLTVRDFIADAVSIDPKERPDICIFPHTNLFPIIYNIILCEYTSIQKELSIDINISRINILCNSVRNEMEDEIFSYLIMNEAFHLFESSKKVADKIKLSELILKLLLIKPNHVLRENVVSIWMKSIKSSNDNFLTIELLKRVESLFSYPSEKFSQKVFDLVENTIKTLVSLFDICDAWIGLYYLDLSFLLIKLCFVLSEKVGWIVNRMSINSLFKFICHNMMNFMVRNLNTRMDFIGINLDVRVGEVLDYLDNETKGIFINSLLTVYKGIAVIQSGIGRVLQRIIIIAYFNSIQRGYLYDSVNFYDIGKALTNEEDFLFFLTKIVEVFFSYRNQIHANEFKSVVRILNTYSNNENYRVYLKSITPYIRDFGYKNFGTIEAFTNNVAVRSFRAEGCIKNHSYSKLTPSSIKIISLHEYKSNVEKGVDGCSTFKDLLQFTPITNIFRERFILMELGSKLYDNHNSIRICSEESNALDLDFYKPVLSLYRSYSMGDVNLYLFSHCNRLFLMKIEKGYTSCAKIYLLDDYAAVKKPILIYKFKKSFLGYVGIYEFKNPFILISLQSGEVHLIEFVHAYNDVFRLNSVLEFNIKAVSNKLDTMQKRFVVLSEVFFIGCKGYMCLVDNVNKLCLYAISKNKMLWERDIVSDKFGSVKCILVDTEDSRWILAGTTSGYLFKYDLIYGVVLQCFGIPFVGSLNYILRFRYSQKILGIHNDLYDLTPYADGSVYLIICFSKFPLCIWRLFKSSFSCLVILNSSRNLIKNTDLSIMTDDRNMSMDGESQIGSITMGIFILHHSKRDTPSILELDNNHELRFWNLLNVKSSICFYQDGLCMRRIPMRYNVESLNDGSINIMKVQEYETASTYHNVKINSDTVGVSCKMYCFNNQIDNHHGRGPFFVLLYGNGTIYIYSQ